MDAKHIDVCFRLILTVLLLYLFKFQEFEEGAWALRKSFKVTELVSVYYIFFGCQEDLDWASGERCLNGLILGDYAPFPFWTWLIT